MKVTWSKKALSDYHSIIDYLKLEWSENSAEKFIDLVYTKIQLIKTHPEAFERTDYTNVNRVIVSKQVTLFFKISKSRIYLLRFWNNYQNPKNLIL